MNTITKPAVPQEVYKNGILYSTIIDFTFIEQGHAFLKPGWFPVQVFNSEHPEIVDLIKRCHTEQAQALARKEVDWERLENTIMVI